MTEHDQLPLPDYDHLPVQGLISRIRTLDATGLQTLLDYEKAHADRLAVVTMLENRIANLRREQRSTANGAVTGATTGR